MADPTPWWQAELEALAGSLRGRLRVKLPAMRQDHDDLVNTTLEGLTSHISRGETVPESWLGAELPDPEDQNSFYRIGHTILNRRITDLLRKRYPTLLDPNELDDAYVPEDTPDQVRQLDLMRLLKLCSEFIGMLPADDRRLIHAAASGPAAPLNPKERQQLRRLRTRLSTQIEKRLGQSVSDLLQG